MLFHPVHYYYSYHGYHSAGDRLWSIFSTVLFIAFVMFAIVLLVRTFSGPRRGVTRWGAAADAADATDAAAAAAASQSGQGEALDAPGILAERYARGEISEPEFRERAEVLRQTVTRWRAADGRDRAAAQPPRQQRAEAESAQVQPPRPPSTTD
jgi:uncharacterized membrane protein